MSAALWDRRMLRLLDALAERPTMAKDLSSYVRPRLAQAEDAGLIECGSDFLWRIKAQEGTKETA